MASEEATRNYNRPREYIVVMTGRSNRNGRGFSLRQCRSKLVEQPGFMSAKTCDEGRQLLGTRDPAAAVDSTAHVFSPVVGLFEAKHFADLAVRQGRLVLAHLAREGRLRHNLLKRFLGRNVERDRIVGCVKHLEAEAVLFEA